MAIETEENKIVRANIRYWRRAKDLTQTQAANLAGFDDAQWWNQIEKRSQWNLTPKTIERVATALGMTPEQLRQPLNSEMPPMIDDTNKDNAVSVQRSQASETALIPARDLGFVMDLSEVVNRKREAMGHAGRIDGDALYQMYRSTLPFLS